MRAFVGGAYEYKTPCLGASARERMNERFDKPESFYKNFLRVQKATISTKKVLEWVYTGKVRPWELTSSQASAYSSIKRVISSSSIISCLAQPGFGKSFLASKIVNYLDRNNKKYAILASSGIAASHLNGSTINGFYELGRFTPRQSFEIGEEVLGNLRPICIIAFGDYIQLSNRGTILIEDPDTVEDEFTRDGLILYQRSSVVLLRENVRQSCDPIFQKVLNEIREKRVSEEAFQVLQSRHISNLSREEVEYFKNNSIYIFPTNKAVDEFRSKKNLWPEKRLVSGSLGTFEGCYYKNGAPVFLVCKFKSYIGPTIDGLVPIFPERDSLWDPVLKKKVGVSTFPIKIAEAITSHKSLGLTIEEGVTLFIDQQLARDQIKLAAQEQENEGTKFRWYRSPLFVSYLDKAPLTHKEKQGFEKLSSHQCQTGRGLYSTRFRLIKETHNKQVQVYEISYAGEDITSVEKAFEVANLELYNIISTSQTGMNVSISLDTVMERVKDLSTFDRTFFGAYITFQSSMFISTKLRAAMDYLNAGLALYENVESGAGLKYVKKMIVKAFPLTHGKMAGTYIKLPKELRRKHVVSIKAG
ncbi:ATP-dependent DNA helicase pif1 [Folsomia candida]|uniref:ATP-dependent DNA helicase n=1 Tax=Folsomia candida TaxID=158441 RepID=A0A226DRQ0_FOLCA|nr:ATP-dependent DNA helicase pif1 [Folsomia candida]